MKENCAQVQSFVNCLGLNISKKLFRILKKSKQ